MKESARPTYRKIGVKDAVRYNKHVDESPMYLSMVNKLVRIAGIKPGEKVLCLAGGTGLDAREALKHNTDVIITDLALPMLKAAKRNKNNRVHGIVESDAAKIPFTSQIFDHILINAGGEYILSHLHEVFEEAYRVLKPGGSITFNCQTDELGVSYPGDPQRALRKEVEALAKERFNINISSSKPKSTYNIEDIINIAKGLDSGGNELTCSYNSDEAIPASISDSQKQLSIKIFNSVWLKGILKINRSKLVWDAASNLIGKVNAGMVNLDNVRHWHYFKFVKNS